MSGFGEWFLSNRRFAQRAQRNGEPVVLVDESFDAIFQEFDVKVDEQT